MCSLDAYGDQPIGEYETAEDANVERKIAEVQAASIYLRDVFRKHGRFEVRWSNERRAKVIRVDGVEVGEVPFEYWRDVGQKTDGRAIKRFPIAVLEKATPQHIWRAVQALAAGGIDHPFGKSTD